MTINLNINGKNIRVEVELSEEKDFRDAQVIVNKLIESYHNQFNTLSSEEILTRVAYDLAVNLVWAESQLADLNSVLDQG